MRYVDKICNLFLLLVLFSGDLSAQTATTVSGYPVIDLSALNPLGVLLSSSEAATRRTEMNAQTPSNTQSLAIADENGAWNAKMSIKYQVMRTDHTVGTTDWANAYIQCKNYNGDGGSAGQWRLPTQRELTMIWILHPQLIGKGSFTAFTATNYWSSSEDTATDAWYVSFSNGTVSWPAKTSVYKVRCVRDL